MTDSTAMRFAATDVWRNRPVRAFKTINKCLVQEKHRWLFSSAAAAVLGLVAASAPAADVQVNSQDNNAANLGNFTSESETFVARSGDLSVIGYNSSRQAGLLGSGAWTSLSGVAFSNNGGVSYTDAGFVPAGAYTLEGDPTIGFDRNGNVYYASLLENNSTGNSYIGVNKSTSTSPLTFGAPVLLSGASSTTSGFEDKELLAVDNTGGSHDGRVYVAWSDFPPSGNPQVEFAASSSTSPLTFGASIQLAPQSSAFQHGAFPAVGPDGAVYVTWSTLSSISSAASATINLVKSTNGGAGFGNPDPSDPASSKTVAAFTSTVTDVGTGGQSVRTRTFPYLAIDQTPAGSATHGNLYMVFQAQPTASASPRSEIFFTSSADGGKSWSSIRNISSGSAVTLGGDSTANDNWLPTIAVSPSNGHIKVLFYSRREDPSNQKIRVYEAGSTDGGQTWYNQPFSDVNFTPSDGYDALLVSNYMGDYINAAADGSTLIGSWGDTRNACAPPPGASAPCSPSGRGDQDAWARVEQDKQGPDLAITPWGYVTGVGPLWQSPDIFTVNGSNAQVNAEKGIHNALRARIRNVGNAGATSAVVRFRYAPIYGAVPDSAFKTIGSVTINLAAGANQVVPIDWDLTNLADTNGGAWPMPISAFEHFCVRVDVTLASDANLSNNDAQNNFVDVSTGTGPLTPIRFIIGNPYLRRASAQMVVEPLPERFRAMVAPSALRFSDDARIRLNTRRVTPAKAASAELATERLAGDFDERAAQLESRELRVGTITLTRPSPEVTRNLDEDLVANVDTVVDGKIVGGFSVLLARANTPKPILARGPIHVTSVTLARPAIDAIPAQTTVTTAAVVGDPTAVHRAMVAELNRQQAPIAQNDPERRLVSLRAVPLSHEQLMAAVAPQARNKVAPDATGRYFLSAHVREGAAGQSVIEVSARVLVVSGDLDSPLGGRLLPSSGVLEQSYLRGFSARMRMVTRKP